MDAIWLTGSSELNRSQHDLYETPRHAVESLLAREKFEGKIWEPACGRGAISQALQEAGHEVISTDLFDWGHGQTGVDFLTEVRQIENCVTNPPYLLAQQFVEHALECTTDKVAMLLKLNFLEGKKRQEFWKKTPLRKVYVFSQRLSFDRAFTKSKGRGVLAYAWMVWQKNYKGEPTLGWI